MKKLKNSLLSGLFALGALGTLTLTSCNRDECKDVVCNNGGVCNETNGSCNCANGYEGAQCETESREKFIDTWNAVDLPPSGNPNSYTCAIIASSASVTSVIVDNNFSDIGFVNNIIATVSDDTITIPFQDPDNDGVTVEGTGTYNNGIISWDYTITDTNGPVNFTGTWQ